MGDTHSPFASKQAPDLLSFAGVSPSALVPCVPRGDVILIEKLLLKLSLLLLGERNTVHMPFALEALVVLFVSSPPPSDQLYIFLKAGTTTASC